MTYLLYSNKGDQHCRYNNDSDSLALGNERLRGKNNYNDESESTTYADEEVFPRRVLDGAEKEAGHMRIRGNAPALRGALSRSVQRPKGAALTAVLATIGFFLSKDDSESDYREHGK